MFLYFISKCLIASFTLLIGADSSSIGCDESFLGRLGQGIIKSYNFPFNYRHNLTCKYKIFLPENHDSNGNSQICFTFKRFELEDTTPFCSYDYLKFLLNDGEFDPKYCGSGSWQKGTSGDSPLKTVWSREFCWIVKSDHFELEFSSDDNENRAGFYATYQVFLDGTTRPPPMAVAPDTAPCENGMWTCFNRRCIAPSEVCDGVDSCGDGSDESYFHARCGEESVMACDFSSQGSSDGFCGFTHERWFRTKTSSSAPSAPSGDHTNGTHGFYVYTDSHERASYLLSPEMSLSHEEGTSYKPYCLTFWYYVYGSPPSAQLSVYVSREQAYSRPEWSHLMTSSGGWRQAQVSFHTRAQLQVIFAAELHNRFSAVALDDISINAGKCTGDDISCNFETGLCAWSSVFSIPHAEGHLQADVTWHVSLPGATDPNYDNSSVDGGGHYIFMNRSSAEQGTNSRALLYSPPVSHSGSSTKCLRFAYYMVGAHRNCCVLTVKLHEASDQLSVDKWSRHGDIRRSWQQAHVQLDINQPFQVILEGVVSHTGQSRIAVDRISLYNGECTDTGTSSCASGQYLCANGECIDGALKCDGHAHCADNSDEDWHASCPPPPDPPTPETTSTSASSTCTAETHACVTGDEGKVTCISRTWLCDGVKDCTDDSDEQGCTDPDPTPVACSAEEFACNDGTCIYESLECDGVTQCADGSDEHSACEVTPPRTCVHAQEFECGDLSCISLNMRCDGARDCADGSDEIQCNLVKEQDDPGGISAGGVAGIVIALLVLLLLILVIVLFLYRRSRQKPRNPPPSRADTVSTIAFAGDSLSRRMVNGVHHPPPYGEPVATTGILGPDGQTLGNGEEPPPPYDAAMPKETSQQRRRAVSAALDENAENEMVQQNWQATAATLGTGGGTLDRRSTRSMPSRTNQRRQRAGSLPQARMHHVNAANDSVYVPRKYVPDPTVHGPFQRSQSMFPERTRPLPRPPGTYTVYPPPRSAASCQGRIKLGTHALRSPRNYMNQGATGQLSECDSDSTVTNTDHIYETLNLPSDSDNASRVGGSRSGSLHGLNHSHMSTYSSDPSGGHPDLRNASCSSEVFDQETSPQSFGPGFRPGSSSDMEQFPGPGSLHAISNSTARILYPNSSYNKQNAQFRDRNLLYRQNKQRPDSNLNQRISNPNLDKQRPMNRRYTPNYIGNASSPPNSLQMQAMNGAPSGEPVLHNGGPVSPQSMASPGAPHQLHPGARYPTTHQAHHSSPAQGVGVVDSSQHRHMFSPNNVASPLSSTANKSFTPVSNNPGNQTPQSPWQQGAAPQHTRNNSSTTSTSGARDLPTPDSQSNLIPSSNNSSFDQTQPSVIFLSDMDTDHMNPTCV